MGIDLNEKPTLYRRVKNVVIGGARSPTDKSIYHRLSLIAFFAWVGLGADGLSSSCYGPGAAYVALGREHAHLALLVALASGITIFVISSSYRQIIELFPAGGGGYVVASKLLHPQLGMVAGCALLVDYVLTITTSLAAGAAALFSLLSYLKADWPFLQLFIFNWHVSLGAFQVDVSSRLLLAVCVILVMMVMNLRGVKESIAPLIPIFLVFVLTHAFVIVYSLYARGGDLTDHLGQTAADVRTGAEGGMWGLAGLAFIMMRAYSMGAGTYTGIEAVSNGLPLLREPRAQTGKRAMTYMWVSLAVMVMGLMLAYLLWEVPTEVEHNKTINGMLLESMTSSGWTPWLSATFVMVTLVSEVALLFVAAQTGFLGGPRVLSYMASDRWFPSRLSMLSDRLVTHNGVLIMGVASLLLMVFADGSVEYLLVLYAINVFITFLLSQAGMVRHWWTAGRSDPHWRKKLFICGLGAVLTACILVWMTVSKFLEGGWVTLVVTASLVTVVSLIRRHYKSVGPLMQRLNRMTEMVAKTGAELQQVHGEGPLGQWDPKAKTAVILVNGFNGFGMHTLLNVLRFFGDSFKNFIFVQIGVVDAGNFKGISEVNNLQGHIQDEVNRYIAFVRQNGYYGEGFTDIGTDVVEEISEISQKIIQKYPDAVFFAGQLVFPKDNLTTRLLHNYITFAVQRRLYRQGVPFVILPIRV